MKRLLPGLVVAYAVAQRIRASRYPERRKPAPGRRVFVVNLTRRLTPAEVAEAVDFYRSRRRLSEAELTVEQAAVARLAIWWSGADLDAMNRRPG